MDLTPDGDHAADKVSATALPDVVISDEIHENCTPRRRLAELKLIVSRPDTEDTGFLRDVGERDADTGFEMGIPLPAIYERVSPAGAPPEGPSNALYPTASQKELNMDGSTLSVGQVESASRRTSLHILKASSSSRRASLQVEIPTPGHRRNSHNKTGGHHHHHRHHHHHGHHHHHHRHSSHQGHTPRGSVSLYPWEPSSGDQPMYDGPDLPIADLPEDHVGLEPMPLPVDLSKIHVKFTGYDTQQQQAKAVGLPAAQPSLEELEKSGFLIPEQQFSRIPEISKEDAKEAILNFVQGRCCYGEKVARDLHITKVMPSSALRYSLDTFTEERHTSWEQEPYMGEEVDGSVNGDPPSPWSVCSSPTEMFKDEVQQLEVPHTCHINPCHGCGSMGWVRCHSCLGRGYKRCITCQGTGRDWKTDAHGHRHVESCWQCHGNGRKKCLPCGGDGRIVCRTCQGYKQLKCYIRIGITYINHHGDHMTETTDLPEDLINNVQGLTLFEQTHPRVWPITDYPDQQICFASRRLLEDHWSDFQHTQIYMQRHSLYAVPISKCTYMWKGKEHHFWVFGKEMAVYAPDYPLKFCWGCTLL